MSHRIVFNTARFHQWLDERGMSLRTFGDVAGLSESALSRLDRGLTHASGDTVCTVLHVTGLDFPDLFTCQECEP